MRDFDEIRDNPRINSIRPLPCVIGTYSANIYLPPFVGSVVFGFNEDGMEHVSISHKRSSVLPSWDTMCKVKEIFWKDEEMVVQIHPAKSQYLHGVSDGKRKLENVLHLWRPVNGDFGRLNDG